MFVVFRTSIYGSRNYAYQITKYIYIYKFHISSHFEKFSKHERNGWNMVKVLRHDQSRNRYGKGMKEKCGV